MNSIQNVWAGKLHKLHPNVSNSKGEGNARYAPHKPLLLLCILDLADGDELNLLELGNSPELRLRFDSYWSLVHSRWGGRPGLDLPFHHLGSQGFWETLRPDGTRSTSADTTSLVRFNPEFYECLEDSSFRRQARFLLIRTWFPEDEQEGLLAAMGIGKAEARKADFKLRSDSTYQLIKGRDARFRITVVTQYRFTCALTGYGLHTRKGSTIVEAAHIHSFSKSRNDNPDNGLALTRDAHWMFDEGLWTLDENHHIRVASEIFIEWGNDADWLKARDGLKSSFLEGVSLRPCKEHLQWHRENVFAG